MTRTPIRTVSLDAVGTLFGLRESPGRTYARFAEAHGMDVDPEALAAAFGPVWKSMPAPDYGDSESHGGLQVEEAREAIDRRWWREIVRTCLQRAGRDGENRLHEASESFERCFDALFSHFATGAPWMVYPETRSVLSQLRERGCQLIVLSNFDRRLLDVVDALELTGLVDQIHYSTALGACKPSPAAFARALERSDAAPETSLHVGDDPEVDGLGAQAAGLKFCHLKRPENDLHAVTRHLSFP